MAHRAGARYARFMSELPTLLTAFDETMAGVRRTLERVPADRLDFRPHPRSWTAGDLATHLARLPSWTRGVIGQDSYDVAPNEAGDAAPPRPGTLAEILAQFDANVTASRAMLAACDAATLAASWSLRRGATVLRTMTRGEAMRSYVLDHAIHHRGQLTVNLRLLDAPVPALFGASADERA